jgi:tetratricopeptide (TPR) repeat protein
VAAVAPLFDVLDVDERQHVGRFLAQDWSDFDEPTLRYCEAAITNLNRQADVLGPRLTLDSVMGHRQLAYRLAHVAPATFQQRAISAYAEFSRLTGWLCFNLGEYDSATHYYEDARTSAHDAHNVELVTFVLCAMSQLATCRGKPRIGIDHAAAAAVWAEQIDSPHARAYAADVAVRAYIADNQPHRSRTTLDHEYAALQTIRSNEPVSRWWYFYDESFYWRTEAEQALKLQQPETALQAVNKSLALIDPAYLHGSALRLLFRAEARIQQQEITEAATIIGNVAQLTATSKSQRVSERIIELRTTLTDWERTKPVRELDDRLKTYRSVHGNGNTKRTYSR